MNNMSVKELGEFIENKNKEKQQLEEKFNKIALTMADYIGGLHEESHFAIYKETIHAFFKERPNEPIAMFMKHIYSNDVFVKHILEGNDEFFMKQTYDDIGVDKNKDTSSKIFEFKTLWSKMNDNTKKIAKTSMKRLVDCTKIYVDVLYEKNTASKQLKEKK